MRRQRRKRVNWRRYDGRQDQSMSQHLSSRRLMVLLSLKLFDLLGFTAPRECHPFFFTHASRRPVDFKWNPRVILKFRTFLSGGHGSGSMFDIRRRGPTLPHAHPPEPPRGTNGREAGKREGNREGTPQDVDPASQSPRMTSSPPTSADQEEDHAILLSCPSTTVARYGSCSKKRSRDWTLTRCTSLGPNKVLYFVEA